VRLTQRVVPAMHDDIQQRRVGEGLVLLLQRWHRPPPTLARC
jgi:hypothetical protein